MQRGAVILDRCLESAKVTVLRFRAAYSVQRNRRTVHEERWVLRYPKEEISSPDYGKFAEWAQGWTIPGLLMEKITPEKLVLSQRGMCWFSYVFFYEDHPSRAYIRLKDW